MAGWVLSPDELRVMQEALSADNRSTSIRLRQGEYQYNLAKAIASFELELRFPDVRDITRRLYGDERANDTQFIRKIQTILKKMEKSDIIRILPKKKPWDLQRYALLSFRFEDVDRNLVVLATDEEVKAAEELLRSVSVEQEAPAARAGKWRIRVFVWSLVVCVSYVTTVWALVKSVIDPVVFAFAFSVAVVASVLLGRTLSAG